MVYSYNKLWKMLIDRKITKTEVRKQARDYSKYACKNGEKDEPVSIETLAKICVALDCGLDDSVEIKSDVEKAVVSNDKEKK